jgi:predicted XRE-type DNA-binding protein
MSNNIWKDLGKSESEQVLLQYKSELWGQLLERIKESGNTQEELAILWRTKQPNVSKIMRGRITDVSCDKLITYLATLGLTKVTTKCKYGA